MIKYQESTKIKTKKWKEAGTDQVAIPASYGPRARARVWTTGTFGEEPPGFRRVRRGAEMIQCKDCELCEMGPDGRRAFKCDPFVNIKEPECIAKWQLIRLDMLVASYQQMMKWYGKLAPLQDKLFRFMKREIDEMDESEQWRFGDSEDEEEEEDEDV